MAVVEAGGVVGGRRREGGGRGRGRKRREEGQGSDGGRIRNLCKGRGRKEVNVRQTYR